MKVFSLGLAICAALAVTTTSVGAKGTICDTGSGFVDTGDSYSSDKPAATTVPVSSSTGSDGTTQVEASSSTAGSDVTQVAGSSSTAGSDVTQQTGSSSTTGTQVAGSDSTQQTSSTGSDSTQAAASSSTTGSDTTQVAASSSTYSDDTPVTSASSSGSVATTASQNIDDSTTHGSAAKDNTTATPAKGSTDGTTSANSAESDVSGSASNNSGASSSKGNADNTSSNSKGVSSASSPSDNTVQDGSASKGSQTGQQDSSVGSSKAANNSNAGQNGDVDSSQASSSTVAPASISASGSSVDSTPTQSSTASVSSDSTPSTAASASSSSSTPIQSSKSGSSDSSTPVQQMSTSGSDNSTPIQQTSTSASGSPRTSTSGSSGSLAPTQGSASASSTGSISSTSTSASAPASTSASASASSSSSPSTFTKVTRLGVRVQGDMPEWNDEHQRFVSAYYDTFDEKYRAVLDTVNMASVEGALKYVQAECINASAITDCERKNSIKYVVFYQTTTVQPTAAMDYYVNATDEYNFAVESCPFMAMDGGQCDPNEDGSFPDVCNQYIGADGQPDLGFCVGGTLQDNEVIAPYPHNYWFSFPNSCPQQLWDDKTDSCRSEYAGGMCAIGQEPDGVTCSFTYEILGYILLDDVVGITSMVNPTTGKNYADYYEFCEAGGVEFSVSIVTGVLSLLTGLLSTVVDLVEGIEFWANPGDSDANAERVEKLVSAYDALVSTNATTSDGGLMRALPTVDDLAALNPPCYENSPLCAQSEFGCKRSYRSQICQVCTSDDSGCEKQ
ncbi:hypothetical protein V7S43_003852 [Phytophthora oleae]|uniref:Uncharacterized protein n=1 Tax=Phytophthora oleae TaxID=2107226 RepID=A0ABD3FWA2_9STRA